MFEAHKSAKRIAAELTEAGIKAEAIYGNVKIIGSDVYISVYLDRGHVWRLYGDRVKSQPCRLPTDSFYMDVIAALSE